MQRKKLFLFLLASLFIIPFGISCGSAKEVEERRNYMMPKKSEVPANSRYKEPGKRKTYNPKKPKSRQKSYF